MNYLFQILSGRPIMRSSVDEVLEKIRLQKLGRKQRMKAELELMKLKRPEYMPGIIPPDVLQDCLSLTKDTVSTLLQIKQKRLAMSNKENTPQITDEMVKRFISYVAKNFPTESTALELWERVKLESSVSSSGRDWEVVSFKLNTKYGLEIVERIYQLAGNKKYNWGTGTSHEALDFDYCINSLKIHSVRRLSDNSIWTVGDALNDYGTITEFKIQSDKWMVAHTDSKNGVLIEDFKKSPIQEKPVLFHTIDNVAIKKGDEYWIVLEPEYNYEIVKCTCGNVGISLDRPGVHHFSTEETAKEYITINKPVLSLKDIESCAGEKGSLWLALKQLASSKIQGGK